MRLANILSVESNNYQRDDNLQETENAADDGDGGAVLGAGGEGADFFEHFVGVVCVCGLRVVLRLSKRFVEREVRMGLLKTKVSARGGQVVHLARMRR